ncbi:MAG: DJ-1/PfpI family protein [Candidatus ainarchaeum sp.]|nr:DJ-1/PfpI family protein [Candidatus ainarchaeum sp.]
MENKKILFVIAPENFRDEELFHTKEVLENFGLECAIASTKIGVCKGSLGKTINSTLTLEQVNSEEYDALIFVGGGGTLTLRNNPTSIKLAKDFYEKNKVIGAICWAPTILAKAGILKGKKATVWFGIDSEYSIKTSEVLEKSGAIFINESVVADGNIITADGPKSAKEFGKKIAQAIKY